MKYLFFTLISITILLSCKTSQPPSETPDYGSPTKAHEFLDDFTFLIRLEAKDKTYGFSEENPIMVGGAKDSEGPLNERRFLNALLGPNGEAITYERSGSCCYFKTDNATFGTGGMLDMYEISYDGIKTPLILYFNMYDSDDLKVPIGFKAKK